MALPTIRPREQYVISRSQREIEGCLWLDAPKVSNTMVESQVCPCQAAYDNCVMFL